MVVVAMVVMPPQVMQGVSDTTANTTAKPTQPMETTAKAAVTENPSEFLA